MNKRTSRFLIAGLLIAWFVDFLFYQKPLGIAFSIWILIAIAALFLTSYLEKVKPHWLSYPLAIFSLGLSTASWLRVEPFTRFIASVGSLAFLMLLTLTFTNGNWPYFRLLDYVTQGFKWLASFLVQSWSYIFQIQKKNDLESEQPSEQAEPQNSNKKSVWPIVRGIFISVPILLILASLLAGADPIFEQGLKDFFKIFKIENIGEYIFRLVYILCLAYVFTGVLAQAIHPRKQETRPDPSQPSFSKVLGSIETKIVFISINLLFITFLVIQFRYFFGGQANINETGFTYSEYARRGFGELVTVAVLSILIYYFFHSVTRLETSSQKRWFSVLSIMVFLQVLVMLFSSYQRLVLYEEAYGFSRLRTYTHLFLPWLALLILLVMVLEITQKQGHLALTLLAFATGFVVTCIVFNIDGFIAKQNIQRANLSSQEGYALDFYYVSALGSDAVPVLVESYFANNPATKDLLGANLACRLDTIKNQKSLPWQGFNLSRNQAEKLINQYHAEWQQYPIKLDHAVEQSYVMVDGEKYYCESSQDWID
jgi:hypothetical protein